MLFTVSPSGQTGIWGKMNANRICCNQLGGDVIWGSFAARELATCFSGKNAQSCASQRRKSCPGSKTWCFSPQMNQRIWLRGTIKYIPVLKHHRILNIGFVWGGLWEECQMMLMTVSSQIKSQLTNLLFSGKNSSKSTHQTTRGTHRSQVLFSFRSSPEGASRIILEKPNNMLELYSHSRIGPFCISHQLSCWFTLPLYFWELLFFHPLAQSSLGLTVVTRNKSIFIQSA